MRGLTGGQVLRRHALRNSLAPTLTVISVQIGYLFGGIVGVELVYNYPGLSRVILNAVQDFQRPRMNCQAPRHQRRGLARAHLLLKPASEMTLLHVAVSSRMRFANSSGLEPITSNAMSSGCDERHSPDDRRCLPPDDRRCLQDTL